MLRIKNLTSCYGKITALENVSLHVWENEIVKRFGSILGIVGALIGAVIGLTFLVIGLLKAPVITVIILGLIIS